ncbi:hypothetical protein ACFVGV_00280 [Pseudarthrobacter scleromae]|uniref:hypothetical protein n=1 Tax=Pseudarthrobacter scleromae TaxID=158897 RepID=UPI003634CD8E
MRWPACKDEGFALEPDFVRPGDYSLAARIVYRLVPRRDAFGSSSLLAQRAPLIDDLTLPLVVTPAFPGRSP